MIKVTNIEVSGWEAAIRGMRNPMNSWEKSDSIGCYSQPCSTCSLFIDSHCTHKTPGCNFVIGQKDLELMLKLAKAGSDHAKYRRMINVTMDILAPLYWWKEFDTYKVGTVANSTSSMHKIHAKEFSMSDFSVDHLHNISRKMLYETICLLNHYRDLYVNYEPVIAETEGFTDKKEIWWQMIQLLPSSYNQLRTVQMNYEVLSNIYHARKDHKLDEWREFCKIIEGLPYSEVIIV